MSHSPKLLDVLKQTINHNSSESDSLLQDNNERAVETVVVVNEPSTSNTNILTSKNISKKTMINIDSDDLSEDIDSLEESRTPLLRGNHEDDDLFDNNEQQCANHSDYSTTIKDNTNLESSNLKQLNHRRLPDDRWKAFIAIVFLFVAALFNDFVLSYIHDIIPNTAPLPDFIFAYTPYWPWALNVSEYLMLTLFCTLLILMLFHCHRWILLRRIATIGSLLYFGRCITMFVTQVPVADKNYYCSPKFSPEERTFWNIFIRGLRVLTGLGLKINGKHTLCGDYIYSGHTIVHVLCYLFIREYSPKRWYILHYSAMITAAIGIICLFFSRGHYTIDVIIAYWITTRLFWEYHTLANIPLLRSNQQERNHLIKSIWFPLFKFMELNVLRPVPRKYGLPFRNYSI